MNLAFEEKLANLDKLSLWSSHRNMADFKKHMRETLDKLMKSTRCKLLITIFICLPVVYLSVQTWSSSLGPNGHFRFVFVSISS